MTRFGRTAVLVEAWIALVPAAALGVGNFGDYGFAYDVKGEQEASSAALKKCVGKECEVVAAMKRNCAAFAIDGGNFCGAYGFAAATRLGPAQNTALQQCYQH